MMLVYVNAKKSWDDGLIVLVGVLVYPLTVFRRTISSSLFLIFKNFKNSSSLLSSSLLVLFYLTIAVSLTGV